MDLAESISVPHLPALQPWPASAVVRLHANDVTHPDLEASHDDSARADARPGGCGSWSASWLRSRTATRWWPGPRPRSTHRLMGRRRRVRLRAKVMAGPRPSSASPFSRWLSVRANEAGLAGLAGSRSKADGPGGRTIAVGNNPVAVAVDQATPHRVCGERQRRHGLGDQHRHLQHIRELRLWKDPPTVTLSRAPSSGQVDAAVD
jgi:hypothetical protein